MATKYLDSNGLLYLWQKIRNTFVSDITWDSTNKKLVRKKKTGTSGAEESTDLVTFATVATSGSYNDLSNKPTIPTLKNVFGKVKVGSSTIEAYTTQDTIELAAGSNITLTPDTTNDKVTISATDTTYESKSAASGGTDVSLVTTGEKYTWNQAEANVQVDWNQTTTTADDYIKNKPTTMTPSSHAHGNITNGGVLQTTGVTIANNDCVVVTDASDSSKVAKAAATFDGSTTTKALSQKGTFETFADLSSSQSLTNKTYNGYTLAGACAKGVVTSISSDSTDLPTVTAVKQYVSGAVAGGAAFQGTAPTTFAPTNYVSGWYWVVGTAGTYAEQTCEAGDMIFATANYSSAYSASDFDVIQTNLDITSVSNAEIDTIVAS